MPPSTTALELQCSKTPLRACSRTSPPACTRASISAGNPALSPRASRRLRQLHPGIPLRQRHTRCAPHAPPPPPPPLATELSTGSAANYRPALLRVSTPRSARRFSQIPADSRRFSHQIAGRGSGHGTPPTLTERHWPPATSPASPPSVRAQPCAHRCPPPPHEPRHHSSPSHHLWGMGADSSGAHARNLVATAHPFRAHG